MQEGEKTSAEASSAVRSRITSEREIAGDLAQLTVGEDSAFITSTELRRNVTRRKSNERSRDSIESTTIPVRSLVSRKSLERPKDLAYAS